MEQKDIIDLIDLTFQLNKDLLLNTRLFYSTIPNAQNSLDFINDTKTINRANKIAEKLKDTIHFERPNETEDLRIKLAALIPKIIHIKEKIKTRSEKLLNVISRVQKDQMKADKIAQYVNAITNENSRENLYELYNKYVQPLEQESEFAIEPESEFEIEQQELAEEPMDFDIKGINILEEKFENQQFLNEIIEAIQDEKNLTRVMLKEMAEEIEAKIENIKIKPTATQIDYKKLRSVISEETNKIKISIQDVNKIAQEQENIKLQLTSISSTLPTTLQSLNDLTQNQKFTQSKLQETANILADIENRHSTELKQSLNTQKIIQDQLGDIALETSNLRSMIGKQSATTKDTTQTLLNLNQNITDWNNNLQDIQNEAVSSLNDFRSITNEFLQLADYRTQEFDQNAKSLNNTIVEHAKILEKNRQMVNSTQKTFDALTTKTYQLLDRLETAKESLTTEPPRKRKIK